MRTNSILLCATLLISSGVASAQVPLDRMSAANRIAAEEILKKPDFTFETRTKPSRVRLDIMEKLFDHPRLAAAMWRYCQFVPQLYAFELPNRGLSVNDCKGLHGSMYLAYHEPGKRVYVVDGRVERWRMGNPMAVGARMVIVYRYWESSKGFESHLKTWTALDSAVLAVVTKPFKRYIQHRQEEFIAYIMGNIAQGGEFAQLHPEEFRDPLLREGDPVANQQFAIIFGRTSKRNVPLQRTSFAH